MHLSRVAVHSPDGPQPRILVAGDDAPNRWVDVRAAERLRLLREGATAEGADRLAAAVAPGSLSSALGSGGAFLEAALAAAESSEEEALAPAGRVIAPIDPVAYRDFMAFEQHFVNATRRLRGADPPAVLYELPVSYFGNAHAVLGPEDEIPWPHYTEHMDYELEVGIVIGKTGTNLDPHEALGHVLGLTLFNDFSARDIQLREMAGGLGPSKGKHFGSSVGPRIVTLDALPETIELSARVNGETWCEGSTSSLLWSIGELVAWASVGEPLVAGTLLGTGTVGGGCGLEIGRQLSPGDVVELEAEVIGVLRNRLGTPSTEGWTPTPRTPSLAGR
jgi:2-keto-4-pentenoate hydratase/2-oxohepta-3-ene-1,7-dioic acid hydratase in catechol pathway